MGIEIVQAAQRPAHLPLAFFVVLERLRRDEQPVDAVREGGRLIWKVAQHGAERNKDFPDVKPVIARVLVFGFHHANHRVGKIADVDGLAERRVSREKLALRVAAQHGHAAPLGLVVPVVEPALGNRNGADFCERRQRANDRDRAAVIETAHRLLSAELR